MNRYVRPTKHYSIWKHLSIASFVIAVLILGTTGCSQLNEEEIAKLIEAEVERQVALRLQSSNLGGRVDGLESAVDDLESAVDDLESYDQQLRKAILAIADVRPRPVSSIYDLDDGYRVDDLESAAVSSIYDLDDGYRVDDLESLESDVYDLEHALFGYGGIPYSSDVIGDLEERIDDLESAVYLSLTSNMGYLEERIDDLESAVDGLH